MEPFSLISRDELPMISLTCKFCMTSNNDNALSFRDLTLFYNVFKHCGLGINIQDNVHHCWVCVYCWTRASQCLVFIETARKVEHMYAECQIEYDNHNYEHITPPINLTATIINYDAEETDLPHERFQQQLTLADDLKGIFHETKSTHPAFIGDKAFVKNDIEDRFDVPLEEWNFKLEILPKDEVKTYDVAEKLSKNFKKKIKHHVKTLGHHSKRTRKDPEELVTRWQRLGVQVLNLTENEQHQELAERRLTNRYQSWRFKCEKCATGFHEEESLKKHNYFHDKGRGEFECPICFVRFATPHQMSSHCSAHRRRWKCMRCHEIILKSEAIEGHHARCTGSAPVSCDTCGKFYPNKLRLRKHIIKIHSVTKQYVCDTCGKTFNQKQSIKYHMRTHTKEMPYECVVCGKKSATSTTHKIHMSVHSQQENAPELYCVECDKYFKNKYIMHTHFKTTLKHNSRDNFQHACAECSERFPTPRMLRQHVAASHIKQRTHSCALCDKSYYTNSALSVHIKEKHSEGEKIKAYVCNVCGRNFATRSQLKTHSRIHTKERPYACLLCKATFSFNSALYTHSKLKHKMTTAEVKKKLGIRQV